MKCSRCGCARPECGDLVEVREFIQKGKDPVIEVCDPIQTELDWHRTRLAQKRVGTSRSCVSRRLR
jgi:hypothetical protein